MLALLLAAALLDEPSSRPAVPARPDAAEIVRFARERLAATPEATPQDAYKWLFQAIRGAEHAVPSEAAARSWLEREWDGLGPPRPGEPLLVPLRPDGAVVRLNLRPFRAAGGDREALLSAFLASARRFVPDPGLFVAAWREFGKGLPARGGGAMSRAAFEELDRASEAEGWPARHHGRPYAEAHVPAYRVLAGEAAEALVAGLGAGRASCARRSAPRGAPPRTGTSRSAPSS
jgi:hypothetical protein